LSDPKGTNPGDDEAKAPPVRDKPITGIRRRIEVAEQLADEAVAAELDGDHRTAADLYRRAIDALTIIADAVTAAANDMASKHASVAKRPSPPPQKP